MSCPPEETWAVYADGELRSADVVQIESHLAACGRCHSLLATLRAENRMLAGVLAEAVPEPAARPAAAPAALVGVLALLAVAAAGVHALWGLLAGLRDETPLGLVDPRSTAVGILFDAFFYLVREGASMLDSILSTLVVLAVAALGVALVLSLRRRLAAVALALSAVLALVAPCEAIEKRTAHHGRVLLPAGETIDDSLFAAGETVTIDGDVNGNLIAVGRQVVVRGTVKGDLLTAAQRLEVAGRVEGNVFGAAETCTLRGPVARSAYGFAQEVRLEDGAEVHGDLVGFGAQLQVDGRVGRDLVAFAGTTDLVGDVGRNVSARTGRLSLERQATVGGDIVARVPQASAVSVDPQAKIAGNTETKLDKPRRSRYARPSYYVWKLVWLAAAFVTGLVLYRLLPGLFPSRLPEGGGLLRTLGFGFAALVAVPIGAVMAALTLVGLPLGLLVCGLWLAGLYVAKLLVAAVVGRSLLQVRGGPQASFVLALLVGLLIVTVLASVPYLGVLVRLAVVITGLGLAATRLTRARAVEAS